VGPVFLGVARTFSAPTGRGHLLLVPYLRVSLPLAETSTDLTVFRANAGLGAAVELVPRRLLLHGRVFSLARIDIGGGNVEQRLALGSGIELAYHPAWWFAVIAGPEVQVGWYGGIDHIIPKLTFRFAPGQSNRLDLALALPVVSLGDERSDLVASLAFSRNY
jgi:hypothetical protein